MAKEEIKRLNVLEAAANYQLIFENFCKNKAFKPSKPLTTFMGDFTIADFNNDPEEVKDTYERVKKEWLGNYQYWTELVCVLNHKSWMWFNNNNFDAPAFYWATKEGYLKHPADKQMAKLYSDLYMEADNLFYETYKDNKEAKDYYCEITD